MRIGPYFLVLSIPALVVAGILAEPELFARACAESPTIERKRVLALEFLTECGYGR